MQQHLPCQGLPNEKQKKNASVDVPRLGKAVIHGQRAAFKGRFADKFLAASEGRARISRQFRLISQMRPSAMSPAFPFTRFRVPYWWRLNVGATLMHVSDLGYLRLYTALHALWSFF